MAERLTRIIEDGPISVLSVCQARVEDVAIWKEWSVSKDSSIKEALLRLAAYEGTGLTPEVCAEYRKFEDEVVASGMTFGELVELMHKKKDGRCVVLPCKPGDTVYYPYAGRVIPKRITQYREILRKSEAIDRWYCLEFSNDETFDADDIGKTVFLTRAEAEAALKESNSTTLKSEAEKALGKEAQS